MNYLTAEDLNYLPPNTGTMSHFSREDALTNVIYLIQPERGVYHFPSTYNSLLQLLQVYFCVFPVLW